MPGRDTVKMPDKGYGDDDMTKDVMMNGHMTMIINLISTQVKLHDQHFSTYLGSTIPVSAKAGEPGAAPTADVRGHSNRLNI